MSTIYQPHTWLHKEIIYGAQLNHAEQGIYTASQELAAEEQARAQVAQNLANEVTRATTAEGNKVDKSSIGAANGVAGLDSSGLVPAAQLPSYVDDVLEGTANNVTETAAGTYSAQSFTLTGESSPCTPETGKTYVDTTSNIQYRWSGSVFVSMGSNLTLGSTSTTACRGDHGEEAYTKAHEHANKAVLDTITQAKVDAWDAMEIISITKSAYEQLSPAQIAANNYLITDWFS